MDAIERGEKIRERIGASQRAVERIAEWLRSRGHKVEITANTEMHEPWWEYDDPGDLLMDDTKRVEVKHLTRQFSSPADWPFGAYFIVNAKRTHDNAKPPPRYYIVVSRDLDYAAVVHADSKAAWFIAMRFDTQLQREAEFYFCPLNLVTFYGLPRTQVAASIFADNEFGF